MIFLPSDGLCVCPPYPVQAFYASKGWAFPPVEALEVDTKAPRKVGVASWRSTSLP